MSSPVEKGEPPAEQSPPLRSPSLLRRLIWRLVDAWDNINWVHVAFKIVAYTYLASILYIGWQITPVAGHWTISSQSDKLPIVYQDMTNYFASFNGFSECGIRAKDLYKLPPADKHGLYANNVFCSDRKSLLQAMSNGGRIGFDTPYIPQGCHHRWYSIEEICFILDRFDSVVFVGDSFLQNIYNGLNILLRRDLASGAMNGEYGNCHCENQFTNSDCANNFIQSSEDATNNLCPHNKHGFLVLDSSPASSETVDKFKAFVPIAPRSRYQPIPIIHSISPSTLRQDASSTSLLDFLRLADDSKRKTPMLWIGPTAAGHLDVNDRKGNQEIWDFDSNMAQIAAKNDIEVLKMWNLTVQASSYDGLHFGEKVAITQAMMVVNWLSRLESS